MAMNELYRDADSLPYIVAANVVSGDLVVFASGLVGVAETDAEEREDGRNWATIRTKGVWGFPFTGALVSGAPIYASATAVAGQGVKGTLTNTATDNTAVGTVYLPKGTGAGTAYIRIGA